MTPALVLGRPGVPVAQLSRRTACSRVANPSGVLDEADANANGRWSAERIRVDDGVTGTNRDRLRVRRAASDAAE